MIPIKKLLEIVEFALSQKFDVKLRPDDDNDNVHMKISFKDILITYRADDNALFVEGVEYNGNFDEFDAEVNLLKVVAKIGKMIRDEIPKTDDENEFQVCQNCGSWNENKGKCFKCREEL